MTIKQHRIIQYIAIALIISVGAGWYYNVKVRGAQTVNNDSPSFQADLKNTLDLQAGIGKPTFTRADAADYSATVTDFEGLIKPVKSGEARFEGARRVGNLLTFSENFNSWTKGTATVTTDVGTSPIGTQTADRVQGTAAVYQSVTAMVTARTYIISVYAKSYDGSNQPFRLLGDGNLLSSDMTATSVWKRFSFTFTTPGSGSHNSGVTTATSPLTYDILFWGAQIEEVTGQANQNPSEYVSVGVLTSAPYHGAGVDGVQYFKTYNGNTVASNVVTEATGGAIPDATLHGYVAEGSRANATLQSNAFTTAPWATSGTITQDQIGLGGGTTAWTVSDTSTTTSTNNYQLFTLTAANYTGSIYIKKTSGATVFPLVQFLNATSLLTGGVVFDTNTGVATVFTTPWTGYTLVTTSASVADAGSFWRVSVTIAGTAAANWRFYACRPANFSNSSETNANNGSVTLTGSNVYWGAQVELASFASSYIPTTTTGVTRNGDILEYPNSNFSNSSGTFFADVTRIPSVDFAGIAIITNTTSFQENKSISYSNAAGTDVGNYVVGQIYHTSTQANLSVTPARPAFKAALSYQNNRAAFSVNGSAIQVDTSVSLPTSTHLFIGGRENGAQLYGTIRNVKIWQKALTDAQLIDLTSGNTAVAQSAVKKTTIGADGSSFSADLKNTLDLQAGIGKPTFTRADGADRRATVTDFEGLIKPVKSGEARFEGARRVENLVTYSEDLSNASWAVGSANISVNSTTAPNGTLTADSVLESASNVSQATWFTYASAIATHTYTYSVYVKSGGNSRWLRFNVGNAVNSWFNIDTQTWGTVASGYTYGSESVGNGWYRVFVSGVAGATTIYLTYGIATDNNLAGYTGTAGLLGFYAWGAQLEDVTGQANQNPSEYVSTGVLTSTPYHGANVDGVKYFTTQNGNTVASNVVTEATGTAISDATLHGYVAEGSRTNLALQSEDLTNGWTLSNVTVSANALVAPNGSVTADKLQEDNTTNAHYLYRGTTVAAGIATGSVYIKSGERTKGWLYLYASATANAYFDLQAGTVGTVSGSGSPTATITSVGNGWYRCTLTANVPVNSNIGFGPTTTDGVVSYLGTTGSGIYIWGAQLEAGSFASSYIPTTTASVTRNADVLTYPTAGNVDGTVGTSYVEVIAVADIPSGVTGGYGDNVILDLGVNKEVPGLQVGKVLMFDGLNGHLSPAWIPVKDTKYGVASKWGNSFMNAALDGTLGTQGAFDGNMNVGTNLSIGTWGGGIGYEWGGTIKNVKIWQKALTDTQLTDLTSTTDVVANSAVKKSTVNVNQNDKLTNGLVGLWSFNGTDVSGTTAYDRSGQGNNGTLTGGVTKTIGKVGQALSFDGTSGYVAIGDPANGSLDFGTGDFTLSSWFYLNALPGAWKSIIDKGSAGIAGYGLEINPSNSICGSIQATGGTNQHACYGAPSAGAWHHASVVFARSGSIVVYLDGVSVGSEAYSAGNTGSVDTSYTFNIGNYPTGWEFNGKLDEVRVYNRALSATEVASLYNLGR